VEVAFQGLLAGVEVQLDARRPLLTEDFRSLRCFEGQVTDVDALQGELRLGALVGGGLFGHRGAFLVLLVVRISLEAEGPAYPAVRARTGHHSHPHGCRRSRSAARWYGRRARSSRRA